MSLREKATKGLFWSFAQQFGNQLIAFIISIVLARLLLPAEFGLIGMIAIFVSFGKVMIDSGLTQSLIRNEDPQEIDYSTVFYFNLAASVIIYVLLYYTAFLIADFYNQPVLINIIRLYSLIFIIDAFGTVQATRLTKAMDFKTQMKIAIPSTVIGGVVGIIMALSGFGVWSLVWSNITKSFFHSLQYWFYTKWKPLFNFSVSRFKYHFKFGYNLTVAGLLGKLFDNIYIIVIGRYFAASQVGFYTRADTMKQLPVTNIAGALGKVTYPLFASIQNDNVRLKSVYQQIMQTVIFVIAPTLIFLAVLAEPLFMFLFGEKWLPAVPYFQILCIPGILYPIHSYNLNILKVKGRSDLFLRVDILKKINILIAVAIAINFGIMALLYSQIVTSIISFFINTYYSGKFINYNAWNQFKDIFPTLILATVSGGFIYVIDLLMMITLPDYIRILIGTISGSVVYLLLAYLFRFKGLLNLQKLLLKKKNL